MFYLIKEKHLLCNEEGIRIALSPVQLAAVMTDQTISEGETLSNRVLGVLGVLGGALELGVAGVMCIAPEPTLLTKVGCIALGTHGTDTVQASTRQVITGRVTETESFKAVSTLSQTLGATNQDAHNIALTLEVGVSFKAAALFGAMRASSVRMGRLRLIEHESVTGLKPGGHTIAKHVGQTKEQLLARLKNRKSMKAVSTFYSLEIAEEAISKALKINKALIEQWARNAYLGEKLPFRYEIGQIVGHGIRQGSSELVKLHKVEVVLIKQVYNGNPYYILTAYPIM